MEVVLTKSKKPDEKYDARIDGAKTVPFGEEVLQTSPSMKIQIEKTDT